MERESRGLVELVNRETGGSVPFFYEKIAPVYEATRRMSDAVCIEISREICLQAGNKNNMLLADMGAGTGRFSMPLAVRGCRVVGVDVSRGMLRILLSKLNPDSRSRLQPVVADAEWFPFRPNSFDATVCFQLLHLIHEWHSIVKEVQRTLAKGGLLALGESVGKGFQAEVINAYKELRAKHGHPYKRLGASSLEEVLDYLRKEGHTASSDPDIHNWVGHMTVDSIIQGMGDRVYSRTWAVPQDVHEEIILELREWARKRYNNLELPRETESEFKVGFASFRETGRKK